MGTARPSALENTLSGELGSREIHKIGGRGSLCCRGLEATEQELGERGQVSPEEEWLRSSTSTATQFQAFTLGSEWGGVVCVYVFFFLLLLLLLLLLLHFFSSLFIMQGARLSRSVHQSFLCICEYASFEAKLFKRRRRRRRTELEQGEGSVEKYKLRRKKKSTWKSSSH
jgi:hypothetical protein